MRHAMFTLILSQFLLPCANASKIIGNGAVVLVCDEAPKVRLLDFYEAEAIHFVAPNMQRLTLSDPKGETYLEKLMGVMDRVARRFPHLAREITAEINNFESHRLIQPKVNLGDTNDDFHSVWPIGCVTKNIAIQKRPEFPRSPWFIVSQELWDQLDESGKAGVVLHEAVYRLGIKNGLDNSVGVRYLVGLLFANELEQIVDEDWVNGFQRTNLSFYEMGNVRVPLFSAEQTCDAPSALADEGIRRGRPAQTIFSGGKLVQITYDGPRAVSFQTLDQNFYCLEVSFLNLSRNPTHLTIASSGRVLTVLPNWAQTGIQPMRFVFQGVVSPVMGMFRGHVRPVLPDGSLGAEEAYNGVLNLFKPGRQSGASQVSR